MVATFAWIEHNLTAGDTGVPTNLNFGSTNQRDLSPSLNPITAGTYSYSKWVRGNWTGAFTRIENLQFFASDSGPYVTGELVLCSATTTTYGGTSTYATPVTTLDPQAIAPVPVADPAAVNLGFTGSLANSLTSAGNSDFIVLQTSVTVAASAGPVNQKTFTLQYDEV